VIDIWNAYLFFGLFSAQDGQVKSSQVKSSQVKSSQVKSSQAKSIARSHLEETK